MRAPVLRTLPMAAACLFLATRLASAAPPSTAPPAPAPPPPPPAAAPEVAPVAAPTAEPPPPAPAAPATMPEPTFADPRVISVPPANAHPTDHDRVVGHWGIEARQIGVFQRTRGNDLSCSDNCPITLNSLGVRRWVSGHYAWNAGLALGLGGGSRYDATKNMVQTWDTYLGIGPTVGASFLLTNWRHLAVSFSPQLDAVLFMPRADGPKSFLLNLRGLIEGELHLGFIRLPELSLGISSGLVASVRTVSRSKETVDSSNKGTASDWSIGFSGPQSLWGLVTNMYLRFYF